MRALVGTTGWSHPEWVGAFYPVHLRERPDAWLAHYATRFRTVEVTSSFDRAPDDGLVSEWAREGVALQQRASFEFSLKLPRAITHDALPRGDVDAAREAAGDFDRAVLDPLAGEGLLGAVLVQLPPSLDATPERAAALIEVLATLVERKVALEIRNATWIRDGCTIPELDRLFASREVCLVDADLPGAQDVRAPVGARHAYLRFHGRRAGAWTTTQLRSGEPILDGARYDYLYAEEELSPFAQRIRAHLEAGREVRGYFNNAPRAQAVANALDLLALVGGSAPAPRPRLTAQQRLPL